MFSINIWSIVTATVAAFAIGAIWYSPILFGKEWMSLIKMTPSDVTEAKTRGVAKLYVAQLILTFITFVVMAFAIAALNVYSAQDGAFIGLIAWLGFVLPSALGGMLWEKKSFKLVLITSISTLICWIAGGAIIGGWN